MVPRKSDARRSDASVVVAAPRPASASPPASASASASAPAPAPPPSAGDDDDDSGTPLTPGNGHAQQPAAPSPDKRDKDPKDKDPKDKDPKDKDPKDKDPKDKDAVAIEDLTLPKSIITRLAKGVLPPNTQIQANAILAMSKGATLFISYLASHANEHTTNANKKTISPADVFKALDDTGFAFFRAPLEAEFAKYNAVQTEKRSSYRQKVRAAKDGPSKGDDTDMADTTTASDPSGGPLAKRPRLASHDNAETDNEEPDADDDDDEASMDNEDEVAAAAAAVTEDEDDEAEDDEGRSGDETQDALESRAGEAGEADGADEADEALDGDESD
ncbi:hypothetical protein G6O67_002506 [Ophiocordyceps sinensis]|uniref:DNA polymerase epsilon subunit D n=2 Tax=Ophiocordyceps sinensis TaxID=72228 RepID=A0A8H4PUF6_9HYPO|nr:hypothetical protein G6O67_002506 [Ophiocordyceps sinensis]